MGMRVWISIALASFLVIGGLLLTGHPGFAIRITNYSYYLLVVGLIAKYIYAKDKE